MAGLRSRLIYRARALVRPPVTLGVRLLLHDAADRILLIKHTYAAGWHLPGGGVDPGESARDAAVRELREETGVTLTAPPVLLGLYFNERLARRDHVAVYVSVNHPAIDEAGLVPQALEIAAVTLAPRDQLPHDTTGATRRRIAEALDDVTPAETW